ncbi:MAG: hypothetical protein ACOZFS_05995 [Thermodesulfobacteriota bacterium]
MGKILRSWLALCYAVILGLALMGCASSSTSMTPWVPPPQTAEQLLTAAGFRQVFPATPAQKAKLNSMPQKQIFLISKGPRTYYVYADAKGCGCLYAGNQQNYVKFQKMAADSQVMAERYAVAQMNDWDWYGWGPGWWGIGETGTPE